jgi:putative Mn2+ efflux pump MntP
VNDQPENPSPPLYGLLFSTGFGLEIVSIPIGITVAFMFRQDGQEAIVMGLIYTLVIAALGGVLLLLYALIHRYYKQ